MSPDSDPIPVERARQIVLDAVAAVASEPVPLSDCLDRVAACDLHALSAVPPFDNSAMDGYAVRAADLGSASPEHPVRLAVTAESRAGHPAELGPRPGEAVAISTGAALPAGADAVIPIERVKRLESDRIETESAVEPGKFVRYCGDDLATGDPVLAAGTRLGPAELGSAATAGLDRIECRRRPRVAVLTTGDELAAVGAPLGPGQIHNSSAHSIPAQVHRAGGTVTLNRTVPDLPDPTREAIASALDCDLVLICGGVSVGPHDHVKPALDRAGVEQLFWRVAVRPGGPLWFGQEPASGVPVFGLPGNPVSAMVTFHLFARWALAAMLGTDPSADRIQATFTDHHRKPLGRTDYARCRVQPTGEGWRAHLTRPDQSSHILTSMVGANGLAEIPADREQIRPGETVTVEMLPG